MKIIHTDAAPDAIGPYSQATVVGGLVYTSGQIPIVPATGDLAAAEIMTQTAQVIANLEAVLTAAGSDLAHIVKTTCFLTDMADFPAFNEAYAAHLPTKPARSCVAVRALPKGALVEIEVVAEVI